MVNHDSRRLRLDWTTVSENHETASVDPSPKMETSGPLRWPTPDELQTVRLRLHLHSTRHEQKRANRSYSDRVTGCSEVGWRQ